MPDVRRLSGVQFRGWTLGRALGEGADGIVYAATKDGAERAIKFFFPESLQEHGRAEAKERLDLQLSLVGQAVHPNLVTVYDGGEDEGLETLFLVMDLVPGASLDKVVDRLPPGNIPALVAQLAGAVEYLEKQDLFHRDIKPANVVISDDFAKLTLLDLGIVYRLQAEDGGDRLSGDEFVATLRYSPPEFVWRTEQSDEKGAWRAVSYYQIGATIHDMLMRKPIFYGMDRPRARLYDAVRDHTPVISNDSVPAWLIQTVKACLLKDWRQRLQWVNWDSFKGPSSGEDTAEDSTEATAHRERDIRLRQLRREEMRQAQVRTTPAAPTRNREQDLWHLNSALFMEVRTYLIDSPIFPRFQIAERSDSAKHYSTTFKFEKDSSRDFDPEIVVSIDLQVAPLLDVATQMDVRVTANGEPLFNGTWAEMFTVEKAFSLCKRALLDSVDLLMARE